MFSNQVVMARLTASLLALIATIAGCSSSETLSRADAETEATDVGQTPASETAAQDLTATEAAVAHGDSGAEAQPAPANDLLSPTAPRSYTVKRGDTLWDIATLFLRDPWLWPEVWYINPQVRNPHLIYPGDVLTLAQGADGRPQVRLERGGAARLDPRLRSSPLDTAIPAIPYGAIAAFLTRPSVVSADEARRAPHVLAFRDEHMVGGTGNEVYVRNLNAPESSRFSVLHIGDALRDPDDGDVIGYQGIYTATATVTRPGEPAKAVLTEAQRETLEGDRLFASEVDVPLTFTPNAPAGEVRGSIIAVIGGESLIGQYDIVVINRGKRHGVDAGTVLAVDRAGPIVRDRAARGRYSSIGFGSTFAPRVKLPDERAGTILVFRSFDRLSYALVMGSSEPMRAADIVRNP